MKAKLQNEIHTQIFIMRNKKIMIDRDLAELYGVTTKALNQAVKRNINRFPKDFMFQLTNKETKELVTNCDRLYMLKHSSTNPYAFTEHGAIMLASVLNTEQADKMSIFVVKAFIKFREIISSQEKILKRLDELEKKVGSNDKAIQDIIIAIRQFMMPEKKTNKKIGFQ